MSHIIAHAHDNYFAQENTCMTAVVTWLNNECGRQVLWTVSDSRISDKGSAESISSLTDRCPKVFIIPILAGGTISSTKTNLYSIGFAYAGSTLIGMAAKEIIERTLSSLVLSKFEDGEGNVVDFSDKNKIERQPSIHEIAILASKVCSSLIRDVGSYRPTAAKAEFSVFGYEQKKGVFEAFSIKSTPDSPCKMIKQKIDLYSEGILYLGDRKNRFLEQVNLLRDGKNIDSLQFNRAPMSVVEELISSGEFNGIGGYRQCLLGTTFGFSEYQAYDPSNSSPSYFGFDLENDLPYLGMYQVNLPALM